MPILAIKKFFCKKQIFLSLFSIHNSTTTITNFLLVILLTFQSLLSVFYI